MKLSKYLFLSAFACLTTATFSACENDGDIIYALPPQDATLNGPTDDIVLSYDNLDALALTLYWTENGEITLSDPAVQAPENANANTLQFASDAEFINKVEETISGGIYYRQYTCQELNNLVTRIGLKGGIKAQVYVRLKSVIGANIEPKYSDVITLNITPYFIDMSIGYYLASDKSETSRTLYSPNSDGVYAGFIGANGWENWWLREGNNTIWGNDGVDGTPFMLGNSTTGLDIWNFWYPGLTGCYYTIVDTKKNEWSALYIPELSLSGDISGTMEYDRKANMWNYTFNAEAKTYNITIAGTGKQYNLTTGTDDAAAIDTPVGFSGSCDNLSFGNQASNISFSVAEAGEITLSLNLSDPKLWSITQQSGGVTVVETNPELYLSGIYGEWNFDYSVKLYNEDFLCYGGVLPVQSEWGYKIYTEADNWNSAYTMVEGGSAYEGSLEPNGANNITAPSESLCLFDISLSALTYKVTPVTSVSYTGLNDDWSLKPMTVDAETPWIYHAEFEKTAETPWGVKVVLNNDWDFYFGKGENAGDMRLFQDGFEGDNNLEIGKTYILTIDFLNSTYTYTLKQ